MSKDYKVDLNKINSYFYIKDAAAAFEYGSIKSDKRIQVKMPSFLVDELDAEFPNEDRSSIITMAAIEFLLRKKRIDNPELEHWQAEEQYDLDRMWHYLEERDAE